MDIQQNYTYGDYDDVNEPLMFEIVLQNLETFFIAPLGILGNILIIIILTQKKNRHFTSSVFFTSLAVSDTITISSGVYNSYIRYVERNTAECKVSTFLGYTSVQLSSGILVGVAIERALGVSIPHKVKTICTHVNAKKVVCILAFVLSTFNVSILVSFDIYTFPGEVTINCEPFGHMEYFMLEIYPWLDLCISFAVPYVCIMISSFVIIVKIKEISSRARNVENNRVASVTRTLLAANVAFMITMGPFGVYQIIHPYPPLDDMGYSVWIGLLTLAQSNASINFFLYFLSGPRFRADVKQFFMCFMRQPQLSRPTSVRTVSGTNQLPSSSKEEN